MIKVLTEIENNQEMGEEDKEFDRFNKIIFIG